MSLASAGIVLALALAVPASAQESVFNLPAFGLPATGESIRSRSFGGAASGFEEEVFSLDNPAFAGRFDRAGFYLSLLGQESTVESADQSHDLDDVVFPVAQAVFPAWSGTVFSAGYHQFIDFDAAVESTTIFEGDTLPTTLDSEGGVFVIAPGLSRTIGERTSVGATVDIYLGSRDVIRAVSTFDRVGVLEETADSVSTNFRAVGLTIGVDQMIGDRARVGAALRLRPTVTSEVTESSGDELNGAETEFDLPNEIYLDASARMAEGVRVGASLRRAAWSDFSVDGVTPDDFVDVTELGAAVEFAPPRTVAGFVSERSPARLSYRWRRLPILVDGETVGEWALGAGYGRRFGARSRVDLLLEYGRRGSVDENGLSERFVRLGVGIALFEQWRRR